MAETSQKQYFLSFVNTNSRFIRTSPRASSISSFKVSTLEKVSRDMLFLGLQTFKLGGHSCVLPGRGNALETCQYRVGEGRVAESGEAS